MNELIKEIRAQLNYSQEQLASSMGVSPITISRWENGKVAPSILAQKQLFDICIEHKLDLIEYISGVGAIDLDNKVLYHASRKGINGKIQPISRARCDFGKGFYMGTDPLQPLTLVCNEDNPWFYGLSLDLTGLKVLDVEVGIDWAMLIAYYRGYMDSEKDSHIYNKYSCMADGYDVIVGYIANDRMYQVLTDFFEQRITDTALLGSLSALKLGKQYVAITKKACDSINIESERKLSRLELMLLQEHSIVRRKEGLAIADRIVKEHRRDGRYFDEILRGDD